MFNIHENENKKDIYKISVMIIQILFFEYVFNNILYPLER